jgi:hypothetical protein
VKKYYLAHSKLILINLNHKNRGKFGKQKDKKIYWHNRKGQKLLKNARLSMVFTDGGT